MNRPVHISGIFNGFNGFEGDNPNNKQQLAPLMNNRVVCVCVSICNLKWKCTSQSNDAQSMSLQDKQGTGLNLL